MAALVIDIYCHAQEMKCFENGINIQMVDRVIWNVFKQIQKDVLNMSHTPLPKKRQY